MNRTLRFRFFGGSFKSSGVSSRSDISWEPAEDVEGLSVGLGCGSVTAEKQKISLMFRLCNDIYDTTKELRSCKKLGDL